MKTSLVHTSCLKNSYPNRTKYTLPISILSATIALSLSCIGAFGCNFVEFVTPSLQWVQGPYRNTDSSARILSTTHNQSGIWSYEWWDSTNQQYTCHPYPDSIVIDAKWKASRVLSTVTIVLGGLCLLSFLINATMNFFVLRPRRRKQQYLYQLYATICLIACICETFSLVFLRSNGCQNNVIFNLMRNHTCQLSTGAKCTYVAMFFWFTAGTVIMLDTSDIIEPSDREEEDANLEESLLQEVV